MGDSCTYVYKKLVPEKDAVSIETVPDGLTLSTKHFVQNVLDDVTVLKKRRKLTDDYSWSKNASRMRKKRKDPEYPRRENERIKYSAEKSVHVRKKTS